MLKPETFCVVLVSFPTNGLVPQASVTPKLHVPLFLGATQSCAKLTNGMIIPSNRFN